MHVFWGLEYVGKVSGYHVKQTHCRSHLGYENETVQHLYTQTHQQPQHLDYENETAQHL